MFKYLFEFFLICFFVFFSALFSATETSFTTVSRAKIKHLASQGNKSAQILWKILENPGRFLAAILFGNNLVNIAASALATILVINLLSSFGFESLSLAVGVTTGIMTFILLVFGEITPKTWAINHADRFSLNMAWLFDGYLYIIDPIIRVFIAISNFFMGLLGMKTTTKKFYGTEEEIKTLVSVGREEGVIEEEEKDMIHSIFKFTDTIVRQVMVPRSKVICLDGQTPAVKVIETFLSEGHSRIPIYEDKIDNIIGIVYAKDFLKLTPEEKTQSVKNFVRKAIFIPETKRVSDLLKQMRSAQTHIAIVTDEYGFICGIVTFEDLIEEIIGEIQDEYD